MASSTYKENPYTDLNVPIVSTSTHHAISLDLMPHDSHKSPSDIGIQSHTDNIGTHNNNNTNHMNNNHLNNHGIKSENMSPPDALALNDQHKNIIRYEQINGEIRQQKAKYCDLIRHFYLGFSPIFTKSPTN